MDDPTSVLRDLGTWRQSAAAIGEALAVGGTADWPAARAAYDAVLGRLGRVPDGVAYSTERFGEAAGPILDLLDGELPSVTAIGVQALYASDLQLEVEMVVRVP